MGREAASAVLSPDAGQWGLSVLASSILASSVPASHSLMAVGNPHGRLFCLDPHTAVPRGDPNLSFLTAGPRLAVSLRRRSPFTHLLTITGAATLRAQLFSCTA